MTGVKPSTNHASTKRDSSTKFGIPIVVPPKSPKHGTTIVLLHGRGWTGAKFLDMILSMPLPDQGNLQDALPQARLVFPTAPMTRATKYKRSLIHQWYDGSGDWEPEAMGGMRDSVLYIHELLRDEITLLQGDSSRVVLAGFSQGCAMTLACFLLWTEDPLGAVIGMCGFMPLNSHLSSILDSPTSNEDLDVVFGSDSPDDAPDMSPGEAVVPFQQAIEALREEAEVQDMPSKANMSFKQTPVILCHGTDDPEVEHRHGIQAARLLEKLEVSVQFCTYPGLGHELSTPMLGDVATFLHRNISKTET